MIDEYKVNAFSLVLNSDKPEVYFKGIELLILQYAGKLACYSSSTNKTDIAVLQKNGIYNGEILEVNRVTAYFCYAKRTVPE